MKGLAAGRQLFYRKTVKYIRFFLFLFLFIYFFFNLFFFAVQIKKTDISRKHVFLYTFLQFRKLRKINQDVLAVTLFQGGIIEL